MHGVLAALARTLGETLPTSAVYVLLVVDVAVPVFVLSVALGVLAIRLRRVESDEHIGFFRAWTDLGPRRTTLLAVALLPTAVALALAMPTNTRLLLLLLFDGILGPPLVLHVAALEGGSLRTSLTRARELLQGRGARTILYLVNIVAGTGLLGLFIGGAISYATLGTGWVALLAMPVQALIAAVGLGYVVTFELKLFEQLSRAREPQQASGPRPGSL